MASITYDGQSFLIDGRRIWLAGGTMHPARCPRPSWAERIHAAKMAGLNTITIPVVWSRHEPRSGQFDFTGDNDLRHFVELVGRAGMMCILRMGPFVGSGYDLGGLPPWLLTQKDVALRTANTAFLEASSRFIGAVARQLRDLQATTRPATATVGVASGPGPIVLVQNESHWTCGLDELAPTYLGELNRYLRESGFEVPIINSNELWQGVEGEVDCWTGRDNLLANLRQLGLVRPNQPRLLIEYPVSQPSIWGEPGPASTVGAAEMERNLAEVLSAAGQFNIEPFFGGTNFGFSAGRMPLGPDAFSQTSNDSHAPLDEAGRPGPLYQPLRRVAMFASRFGRVLSNLDAQKQPVAILPASVLAPAGTRPSKNSPSRHSLVFCSGSQGSVGFVFGDGSPRSADAEPAMLLLSDGSNLPVYLGDQTVAWCLFDVRLFGRSQLDYCNLSAFALVGRVFVAYGAPGTPARLSINGSPLETTVPQPEDPAHVIEHEGITVVIASPDHLPSIGIGDDAVYIGVTGLSLTGDPIVARADDPVTRLAADGPITELKFEPPSKLKPKPVAPPPPPPPPPALKGKAAKVKPLKKGKIEAPPPEPPPPPRIIPVIVMGSTRSPHSPTLGHWSAVTQSDYLDGSSARFASITGPADLNVLGAPYGYGWYRIRMKPAASHKTRIAWPQAGDRLHLYLDGENAGVMGFGPGASAHATLPLHKGEQTLVVLAENFGRFAAGQVLGEPKGIVGHALAIEPLKVSKPSLVRAQPLEGTTVKGLLMGVHRGDMTDPHRVTWDLPHKRKTGLIVRLGATTQRGLVLLDDQPLRYFDSSGPSTIVLEADQLSRGNHRLQMAVLGDSHRALEELAHVVTFEDCLESVTAKAEWSFAKWELPSTDAFTEGRNKSPRGHQPTWYRTEFVPAASTRSSLYLDTAGLSKGQVYLNGRHLGRYFTATADGKPVGPQTMLLLPESMLATTGRPAELTIFDEHGFGTGKVRLVYQ